MELCFESCVGSGDNANRSAENTGDECPDAPESKDTPNGATVRTSGSRSESLTQRVKSSTLHVMPLSRVELPVDTVELARFMVGQYLVHDLPEGRICGRIVETEAYPLGDSTSHAFSGRRPHNGSM